MRVTEQRRLNERQERRTVILEAARALYADRGFAGTTMADIARKSHLGTATTYYYFKNKDEIFVTLVLDALDKFIVALRKIEKSHADPIEKVRAMWDFYFDFYKRFPDYYQVLLALYRDDLLSSVSEDLVAQIKEKSAENFRIAARIVQSCNESGEYSIRDPLQVADVLWATFMGIVHLDETRQNLQVDKRGLSEIHQQAFTWFEEGWRAR